jgi:hypothetical protein
MATMKREDKGGKEQANNSMCDHLRSYPSAQVWVLLPELPELLFGDERKSSTVIVDSSISDEESTRDTTDYETDSDDDDDSSSDVFEQLVLEEDTASVVSSRRRKSTSDGSILPVNDTVDDGGCSRKSLTCRKTTTIQFGHIDVIELSMTMGHHPTCRNGPAVCLSSELVSRTRLQLQDYELVKSKSRRTRSQLYISTVDRQRM